MGDFKVWLLKQENFGPGHTGGMNPPLQRPFTRGDAEKRPNDPLGISGTLNDYPPVKHKSPTANHDKKAQKMKKK